MARRAMDAHRREECALRAHRSERDRDVRAGSIFVTEP
jgi:hypothetical protein